jgi:uncharacterized membrane protein YccF (DUF307 family)
MNVLWLVLIGWWLAPLWFAAGVLLCWNPVGWIMVYQAPQMLTGEFN